jgi:cobalamin synthase
MSDAFKNIALSICLLFFFLIMFSLNSPDRKKEPVWIVIIFLVGVISFVKVLFFSHKYSTDKKKQEFLQEDSLNKVMIITLIAGVFIVSLYGPPHKMVTKVFIYLLIIMILVGFVVIIYLLYNYLKKIAKKSSK